MDKRNLPRYNVLPLKAYIKIEGLNNLEVWVKDISLGGIQVYHDQPFQWSDSKKVLFTLGSQTEKKLSGIQCWSRESVVEVNTEKHGNLSDKLRLIKFKSGIRLNFDNEEDFKSWRSFIQAIHQLQKKQLGII